MLFRSRVSDYQTLIKLTIETDKQTRTVAGTLFGGKQPRLVEVNGIKLEAGLGENMIYVSNEDKPGLIGDLGKLLGGKDVNIANFHLGRGPDGAIALVEVDQAIDAGAISEIATLPSVIQAKALKF